MTIEFGDTQSMRVIGDKVLRIDYILDNNFEVCQRLAGLTTLWDRGNSTAIQGHVTSSAMPEFFGIETKQQRQRVTSLLKRMGASSELVSIILN
jgi:hypothetical protein